MSANETGRCRVVLLDGSYCGSYMGEGRDTCPFHAPAPTGGPCYACNAWRDFDPWPGCSLCGKPVCERCAKDMWKPEPREHGGTVTTHVCPSCAGRLREGVVAKFAPPPKPRATCTVRIGHACNGVPAFCGKPAVTEQPGPTCAEHDGRKRATCTVEVKHEKQWEQFGRLHLMGWTSPCGAPAVESGPWGAWCQSCWSKQREAEIASKPGTFTYAGLKDHEYPHWNTSLSTPAEGPDRAKMEAMLAKCRADMERTLWDAALQPICAQGEYATIAARQREGKALHEKINERARPKPTLVDKAIAAAIPKFFNPFTHASWKGLAEVVASNESYADMAVRWMPDELKHAILQDAVSADPHGPPDPSPLAAECGAWVAPGRYCNTRVSTPGVMCEACFKKYDALEPGERPRPEGSEPGPLARECLNEAADARELAADLHDRIAHLLEAGAAGHRDVARFFARQPKAEPGKPGRIARARADLAYAAAEEPVLYALMAIAALAGVLLVADMGYVLAIAYGLLP